VKRRSVFTDESRPETGGDADSQARLRRRRQARTDQRGAFAYAADLQQGEPTGEVRGVGCPARLRDGGVRKTGERGSDRRLRWRHRFGLAGGQPVRRRQQCLGAGVFTGDRRVARRRVQAAYARVVARAQRRGPFQRSRSGGVAGSSARPDRHRLQGAREVLSVVDRAGW
jgi:hypothetical protein